MFFVLNLLCLQGELEVVKVIPDKRIIDEKENMQDQSDWGAGQYASAKETFLMLGLDLPPPQDVMEKNIIPQVLLHEVNMLGKIAIHNIAQLKSRYFN